MYIGTSLLSRSQLPLDHDLICLLSCCLLIYIFPTMFTQCVPHKSCVDTQRVIGCVYQSSRLCFLTRARTRQHIGTRECTERHQSTLPLHDWLIPTTTTRTVISTNATLRPRHTTFTLCVILFCAVHAAPYRIWSHHLPARLPRSMGLWPFNHLPVSLTSRCHPYGYAPITLYTSPHYRPMHWVTPMQQRLSRAEQRLTWPAAHMGLVAVRLAIAYHADMLTAAAALQPCSARTCFPRIPTHMSCLCLQQVARIAGLRG